MTSYVSSVSFECPACLLPNRSEIAVPETNWDGDTADERYAYEIEVLRCSYCAVDFDVEVRNQDGSISVIALDVSNGPIQASQVKEVDNALFDDGSSYEPPIDPERILYQTLFDVSGLLRSLGDSSKASVVNRMAFAQQVAALEAYLSDTLIREVTNNHVSLRQLILHDKDLKAQKISLIDILDEDDLVLNAVVEHLHQQSFHNLGKAQALYRSALNIDILPRSDERERLERAMNARHDCVHRNGFDKNGEPLNFITSSFLKQFEEDITRLVSRIGYVTRAQG